MDAQFGAEAADQLAMYRPGTVRQAWKASVAAAMAMSTPALALSTPRAWRW
jgi:hypothetical protein